MFFTYQIKTKGFNLKENNFYQVEGTLKNKKDNITDISSYTFKKINKIKRNVTFDRYGRMFVNDELFFPFGIYATDGSEKDLMIINRTRLNIISSSLITKKKMDKIQETQQGKIKVIFSLNPLYNLDTRTLTDLNEEENYKTFKGKINEVKDHPTLLAWYINDEKPYIYNEIFRNRTLSIHNLDPNHPSYTVTNYPSEFNFLMNTSDILGLDKYPIGTYPIRYVHSFNDETNYQMLEAKPMIPVVQIFDWAYHYWNRYGHPEFESAQPSFQDMLSMSWQAFVAGGKGLVYYGLYELLKMNDITPFEDCWKDVIELTENIWKYKDVILSIDKVDKIEYTQNLNVTF